MTCAGLEGSILQLLKLVYRDRPREEKHQLAAAHELLLIFRDEVVLLRYLWRSSYAPSGEGDAGGKRTGAPVTHTETTDRAS